MQMYRYTYTHIREILRPHEPATAMIVRTMLMSFLHGVGTLFALMIVFGFFSTAQAQNAPPSAIPAVSSESEAETDTLTKIIMSRQALQEELSAQNKVLKHAATEDQQAAVRKKIQELTTRIRDLDGDFENIATGVDASQFSTTPTESFDWQKELQDLLSPIIDELKRLTARPRELEKLRNQELFYQKRIALIENAIKNIQNTLEDAKVDAVKKDLNRLLQSWQQRHSEFTSRLAAVQQQLLDKEQAKEPIMTSLRRAFRDFFKSRGLNLLLAFLAFLGVFLLLRYAQRAAIKKTHVGKPGHHGAFGWRLTGIIYYILTFLFATGAFLVVLYLSGDWVLLGLALIFLFGVAWTGKQTLPRFWEQSKLLLNLSTVREGERILYQGLPWRVLALNVYTRLHNPELKGGMLRLPLSELIGLQSRPFHKDEPWFPTKEGDLVELSDGSIGVVKLQTPDQVVIDTRCGIYKTYPTLSFLDANPMNYSINTFGIFVTFGLDYAHQADIVRTIPETLHAFLSRALLREEYGADLLDLIVQFKEASASSLDLLVLAKFPGKYAAKYFAMSRALQGIIVEACNTYDWGIPFMQITLHQADTKTTRRNTVDDSAGR